MLALSVSESWAAFVDSRPAVADVLRWTRVCGGLVEDSGGVVRDGSPAAEAGFPSCPDLYLRKLKPEN